MADRVKVLLTAGLEEEALVLLRAHVHLTERLSRPGNLLQPPDLIRLLDGHDVLIVGYDQVTDEVMDACPDLKVIGSIRGGPEANISIEGATARGIPVLYTVGRTQHAVAEYTFALMLGIARNLALGDHLVKTRVLTSDAPQVSARDVIWQLPPDSEARRIQAGLIGTELYRKTLGLVGIGNIGQEVARLGRCFGMRVIAYDPYLPPNRAAELEIEPVSLNDLMQQADFVSLHARVTPESTGVIGRDELRLMKRTAYLVNTARAALLDEEALITALEERWFAGAALDVFHKEPLDPSHPLLELDNVILTPHFAGSTREIPQHHSRMVAEDVISYLQGRIPSGHVKNPEVFERAEFAHRGKLALG